jgi:single-stranded-DNA-specific exonuclease
VSRHRRGDFVDFHEAWSGIVASRIRTNRTARPSPVFAASQTGWNMNSGSGPVDSSTCDALDLVTKRCPGVLLAGGHAMAASCTIDESQFEAFEFAQVYPDGWTRPH